MKTTDKTFLELARRNTQQPTVRVTLTNDSKTTVLGKSDIQSVKVTRSVNGGKYCIGGTESATMVLKVFASALPQVPETGTYKVELGYVDDSGAEHFAEYGHFATNEENVVRNGLWVTVTGYDAFYWMDADGHDFGTADGSSKLSSRSMIATVLDGTSVQHDASDWSDIGLYMYRPDGTVREQIGQLAAANCANAVISGASKVALRTPVDTGITLTPNDYAVGGFKVTTETALPVSRVKTEFTRTYEYDSSSGYDRKSDEKVDASMPSGNEGIAIKMDADLFGGGKFSSDSALSLAKNDLSTIASVGKSRGGLGRSFKGFSATLFGCCFLEPLDALSIVDVDGETHKVCVLSASWTYDGGIKTVLTASASAADVTASSSVSNVANLASQLDSVNGGVLMLEKLIVNTLKGDNAEFNKVVTDELVAKSATIKSLFADKADVDLLNVNNSWIKNGVIIDGSIGSAAIADGAITTLKVEDAAITSAKIQSVDANTITSGTLKTKYLILVDDEGENQSIITALNAKAQTLPGGVLDGAIVSDQSITAGKITVADLKAFDATIGSFVIDDSSIHSNKAFIDDPTAGVYVGLTGIGVGDGELIGKGLNGKASFDDSTGFTIDGAEASFTSDEGFSVDDDISGFSNNVVAIFGDRGSPFEVYADGTVKIRGKNGSIEFSAVTGDLTIAATTLTIGSFAAATQKYSEDQADSALSSAKSYSDDNLSSAKSYSDGNLSAAKEYADGQVSAAVSAYDADLTQTAVFNKLTNNGKAQGIYLDANKDLYINASYIQTGTLSTVTIKDASGMSNGWNLATGQFRMGDDDGYIAYTPSSTGGAMVITATSLTIGGSAAATQSYANDQASSALSSAKSYSDGNLSTAKTYADGAASSAVSAQTQSDIFNKLTKNGTVQGITMDSSGNLYINGSYIKAGTVDAGLLKAGILQDKKGNNWWNLDSGTLKTTSGTIGGFTITGNSIYNDKLTMNSSGLKFKYSGTDVGTIGTNYWSSSSSNRGLSFDLESDSAYMCWACKKSSSSSTYSAVLTYANKYLSDSYQAGKLVVTAPMQIYGNIGLNNYAAYGFWIDPNSGGCNGGISGTISFVKVISMDSDGTASEWRPGCSLTFKNGMLTGASW